MHLKSFGWAQKTAIWCSCTTGVILSVQGSPLPCTTVGDWVVLWDSAVPMEPLRLPPHTPGAAQKWRFKSSLKDQWGTELWADKFQLMPVFTMNHKTLPMNKASKIHYYYTGILLHYYQWLKQVMMSSLLHVMHFPCFHYYFVITHYYSITCYWATCRWYWLHLKVKRFNACPRKGSLLRFQSNSTATLVGCAQKLGNNIWHDSELIATKDCSQICSYRFVSAWSSYIALQICYWSAMFEDHAETCTNEVQCLKTMQRLALTGLASTFNSKIFEQSAWIPSSATHKNHLLCQWPMIHNSISKICPKFQVLNSQFSQSVSSQFAENKLLDEHWAEIVQRENFQLQSMSNAISFIYNRFSVLLSGLDIQLEQSKNDNPACKNQSSLQVMTIHTLFFSADQYDDELMTWCQVGGKDWLQWVRWHWFDSYRMLKLLAAPATLCGTEPFSALTHALSYCCALHNFVSVNLLLTGF